MNHRVTVGAERDRRFQKERAGGVLWRHASVNLVKPAAIALAAAKIPGRRRELLRVSTPPPEPQLHGLPERRKTWIISP
jgi:hypothetical protein